MRWISPPENPTTTSPVVKTSSARSKDMTTEPHGTQQVLVEHCLRPHRVEHHVASSLPLTRHALPHITRLDLFFEQRRRYRVHHIELARRILRPQQSLQEPLLLLSANHAHRLPLIPTTTEYGVMARQTQLCRRQTRATRCSRHCHHLVSRHASRHLQTQRSRTVVDAQNGHRPQRHGLELINSTLSHLRHHEASRLVHHALLREPATRRKDAVHTVSLRHRFAVATIDHNPAHFQSRRKRRL